MDHWWERAANPIMQLHFQGKNSSVAALLSTENGNDNNAALHCFDFSQSISLLNSTAVESRVHCKGWMETDVMPAQHLAEAVAHASWPWPHASSVSKLLMHNLVIAISATFIHVYTWYPIMHIWKICMGTDHEQDQQSPGPPFARGGGCFPFQRSIPSHAHTKSVMHKQTTFIAFLLELPLSIFLREGSVRLRVTELSDGLSTPV